MSEILDAVNLYSPQLRQHTKVGVYGQISEDELNSIEIDWRPIFEKQQAAVSIEYHSSDNYDKLNIQQLVNEYGIPDLQWDWRKKLQSSPNSNSHKTFFLKCDGEKKIEAAMQVDLTRTCHEKTQRNQHMVYIEFLAAAPWNRKQIVNPPKLLRVGTLMLSVAVSLSHDLDWNGRVGLHSLSPSEGFYKKCYMHDLGIDHHYGNLRYFEFTPQLAENFMSTTT
ncbi:MAG: hypothetical protein OXC41_04885 [Gammaproteobacteria bacterium]|nr:hypothetical protein [Gammaproteobacteria bacterium]